MKYEEDLEEAVSLFHVEGLIVELQFFQNSYWKTERSFLDFKNQRILLLKIFQKVWVLAQVNLRYWKGIEKKKIETLQLVETDFFTPLIKKGR